MTQTPVRHFLDIADLSSDTLHAIIDLADALKARHKAGKPTPYLAGKSLAMIFAKPSTRTRVSFEVGMNQLGGNPLILRGDEMQLSREESVSDTAKVLSRFVDAIMIRTHSHDDVLELAAQGSVPVINGLTQRSHPCQIMADLMTYREHRGSPRGKKFAWIGDANNVLASFVHAAEKFGFDLAIASPDEFSPDQAMQADIGTSKANITLTTDPALAAKDADCIIADCWVSMGDSEPDKRRQILAPYQVDNNLMALAKPDAIFQHCLPAHRGEEVTAQVMDGPQSVVFDEAENRLHAQKAILLWCFGIDDLPAND